ncbi:MAG: TonB-dependent receptor [Opitutus sp.]|nr:TonB-dependent receptor [Opitutus sp.]
MKPFSLLFLFSSGALVASAQTTPPSGAPPVHLEEFVVTGSPLRRAQDEVALPTSVVGGPRLVQLRQPTLGETLANEPGISSTYFGPGASRPVIRGLGGDRVRVLTGGVGTLDASIISPDHAVSLDPLLIDRIEIVRGPATLLYGGSAVGGVVNVIDSRIPEELPAAPFGGRIESRYGSAAEERAGAAVFTGRAGSWAWRLDGFTRQTDDVRIPGFAETAALLADHDEEEEGPPARDILPNTASKTAGAGVGLSYIAERGHLGVSYNGFNSLYGVPGHSHGRDEEEEHDEEQDDEEHAEEGVRLDLRQRRWDVHGELFSPVPVIRLARVQLGVADYAHNELEGGAIGTRFTNRAHEGRFELLHEPLGAFEGALGLQFSRSDFAAIGEEAFVPPSVTTNRALFLYEEIPTSAVTWQFGARAERQEIAPEAGTGLSGQTRTGASLSGGAVWKINQDYALAFTVSRNERAPNAQELFADGPHAGTGIYEIGDAALGVERSVGFDVSLRKRTGFITGSVTVFANRFAGYIFEDDTGTVAPDSGLPVYRFVQRDAEFTGGELELVTHLHEAAGRQFDLRLIGDSVRGKKRSNGQPLPRLTPARVGGGIDFRTEHLTLSADVRVTQRAKRLAPGETATDGHALVSLFAAWRFKLARADAELFARVSNLGNETARIHSSFLKDVAPLPGRNFTAGLRLAF